MVFKNALLLLNHELNALNNSCNYLNAEIKGIESIHKRKHRGRRSLIPVEGKALGYLFGLLSDSDVESIRNNINILAKNQRQLTHVVNESLSVIRLSHEQIIENRKSINSVIESLYEFDNLTRAVAQEVKNTHTSLQLYIKFDRVLSEAHELVGKFREYLQNLKLQLNMLALCHLSSSVISPGEF